MVPHALATLGVELVPYNLKIILPTTSATLTQSALQSQEKRQGGMTDLG